MNRKTNQLMAVVFSLLVLGGCAKYDDTAINDRISALEDEAAKLEALCSKMNSEIESLKVVVDALNNGVYVSDVKQDDDSYTVTFTDGRTITVSRGAPVEAPVVSVVKEDDGLYYWTVNGKHVKDAEGNPVCANAVVETPKLRINDGWWEISWDEGNTWSRLTIYSGSGSGGSIFSSVEETDEVVIFTLSDGSGTISLDKSLDIVITFEQGDNIALAANSSVSLSYTVTGAPEGTIYSVSSDGILQCRIESLDANSGKVVVSSPADFTIGRVVFFAIVPSGRSYVKILSFKTPNIGHLVGDDIYSEENI